MNIRKKKKLLKSNVQYTMFISVFMCSTFKPCDWQNVAMTSIRGVNIAAFASETPSTCFKLDIVHGLPQKSTWKIKIWPLTKCLPKDYINIKRQYEMAFLTIKVWSHLYNFSKILWAKKVHSQKKSTANRVVMYKAAFY